MANAQRIASGFPFPVYVNETQTKQRISPGAFVNETIASGGATFNPGWATGATRTIGAVF